MNRRIILGVSVCMIISYIFGILVEHIPTWWMSLLSSLSLTTVLLWTIGYLEKK